MKLHLCILLAGVLTLQPAFGQKGPRLSCEENETTIFIGKQAVLSYVHSETLPPEGVDPVFKRSAYIHPVWSPGGERLTRIQPPDHWHHYGIWNPWTRTHFGDYKVDFWNLGDKQGTVRFAEYLEKIEKENLAGFRVRQEHIYYKKDGSEGVAMDETWMITVKTLDGNAYLVDLHTTLSTPLETGITLEAYRYGGGLGYRGTERWWPGNATVLTSEGKSWSDADATHARWVLIEGESNVPEGRSGILFLSHPDNRSHPEPMRMWPPNSNGGKENMFFEFCPIRHQKWILEPGKEYVLKYRMVVFDGAISKEKAEQYWNEFQ
ncbi:MAG: PmoA family protein [Bacteroidota bacterium]|nr:PmoA family protein [Bacteroidota bacterium]